ncbi:MAG: phytanoyl-CoA dioxygenase, partial [Candidatus Latescibacteria bacterium]|nr:phytanoyl-CoA dioxygenase [Candidatus Latescibacterota bacterium]
MVAREHLLDSKQMAQFVADGYLRFDEIVPDELNKAAYAQMETGDIERPGSGTKLAGMWPDSAIGQIIRLP